MHLHHCAALDLQQGASIYVKWFDAVLFGADMPHWLRQKTTGKLGCWAAALSLEFVAFS